MSMGMWLAGVSVRAYMSHRQTGNRKFIVFFLLPTFYGREVATSQFTIESNQQLFWGLK